MLPMMPHLGEPHLPLGERAHAAAAIECAGRTVRIPDGILRQTAKGDAQVNTVKQ